MIFQTVLIVFWVLFVGIATTITGKLVYDNWWKYTTTYAPTYKPTAMPTPSAVPTPVPTAVPTAIPTYKPTAVPTVAPTAIPTTASPSAVPTAAPTSDNCFEMAFYYCLTCVPPEMQPTLPCSLKYYAPGKCPDNATCELGWFTCNPGYISTYVNPRTWGDGCQYCKLSYTCVPMNLRH